MGALQREHSLKVARSACAMQGFPFCEWEGEVVIATFWSILSTVPRCCTRLTYFLHPKLRKIGAVLITAQLSTLTLRRLWCARGAQEAFPLSYGSTTAS